MNVMQKVTQHLRKACTLGRHLAQDGLINTTDLLVATGATVVLAAGVGAAVLGTLDDAKYAKAQPDAQALASAISQFYKDTGKWPGQAEHAAYTETAGAVPSTLLLSTLDDQFEPEALGTAFSLATADCRNNSLQGFVGKDIASAANLAAFNTLNINDYLVRKPNAADYPNWQGPYLQADIKTDPWDRAWVANLQPLYCAELIEEAITGSATTAGDLGYAWLLSGGSNRTISTALTAANLDPTGDDAGVNLGKLLTRAAGGLDANGGE